jgi:hypothetical protein
MERGRNMTLEVFREWIYKSIVIEIAKACLYRISGFCVSGVSVSASRRFT